MDENSNKRKEIILTDYTARYIENQRSHETWRSFRDSIFLRDGPRLKLHKTWQKKNVSVPRNCTQQRNYRTRSQGSDSVVKRTWSRYRIGNAYSPPLDQRPAILLALPSTADRSGIPWMGFHERTNEQSRSLAIVSRSSRPDGCYTVKKKSSNEGRTRRRLVEIRLNEQPTIGK